MAMNILMTMNIQEYLGDEYFKNYIEKIKYLFKRIITLLFKKFLSIIFSKLYQKINSSRWEKYLIKISEYFEM